MAQAVEDPVDVLRLHAVKHQQRVAGHPHVDERLLGAEAEATDRHQLDGHAPGVDLGPERVIDGLGAVPGAAGSHADRDARPAGEQLRKSGLARSGERGEVLDLHRADSLRSASISRISICSFTWPRIAWSISTTGASAHWPKQATVRIVKRWSGVVSEILSAPSLRS